MPERAFGRVDPAELDEPDVESSDLHVASTVDVTAATEREERLDAILRRADVRDLAAEARDRAAERRDPGDGDRLAAVDRDWAGRDRDLAAQDRADLLALLRGTQESTALTAPDQPQE